MNDLKDTFTLGKIVKLCLQEIEHIKGHYKFYRSKEAIEMHGKDYCKGAEEALQMAITDHLHNMLLKLFDIDEFEDLYSEIERFREDRQDELENGKIQKNINIEETARQIRHAIEMITSHGDYTDYFDEQYKNGIELLEIIIGRLTMK